MSSCDYDEAVKAMVVAHADALDFVALCKQLGSVYPVIVWESLQQLKHEGVLSSEQVHTLTSYQAQYDEIIDADLPVPHPLDSDWRLDRPTRDCIAQRLVEENGVGDILLIGVPTVYQKLATMHRSVMLVDTDEALQSLSGKREHIIICSVDQLSPIEPRVSGVFADPPWYVPVTLHSVWFAAASARVGAKIFLSIPGELTRPGISAERLELEQFAATCGLVLSQIERGTLGYLSPPFEIASLRAAGFASFSQTWRRGDLAVFERVVDTLPCRPLPLRYEPWMEVVIEGVRIRFRLRESSNFDPTPISLGESTVRKTVSARDPGVALVDVWTSGNQIFRCESPSHLAVIARSVIHGYVPDAMIQADLGRTLRPHERILVGRARDELQQIVERDITKR